MPGYCRMIWVSVPEVLNVLYDEKRISGNLWVLRVWDYKHLDWWVNFTCYRLPRLQFQDDFWRFLGSRTPLRTQNSSAANKIIKISKISNSIGIKSESSHWIIEWTKMSYLNLFIWRSGPTKKTRSTIGMAHCARVIWRLSGLNLEW